MTLRRHPISGEPILYAPGRARRPNAFGREETSVCPFCPGNESQTPPELARIGDPWRVRVFPNKYPAIEGHEVIVDSSRHDAAFDTIGNAAEVAGMYIARYRAHSGASFIAVFQNFGERAGASIDHIHSQVMPLPFIPPRIERQLAGFGARDCPLCGNVGTVLDENAAFLRLSPGGSQQPFEQWIVPKRHEADFTTLSGKEVALLAAILQTAVGAARRRAPAYNILFMNFPRGSGAHFYVDVFPRMTAVAGFELGTGTFIDIIE